MPYQLVNSALMRQAMPIDEALMESWPAPDGWPLRRVRLPGSGKARGSLLFIGGRADHIEKYDEALLDWVDAGWDVESVDWRGQGGSGRMIAGSALGHAEDFACWLEDIEAYVAEWRGRTRGPRVIVAHSMGGHLVLRALAEGRLEADAVALSAPMLGIRAGPLPQWLAGRIAAAACALGLGERAVGREPVVTIGETSPLPTTLTHDRERFLREARFEMERPDITLGPPTWGWLHAAFRSLNWMARPGTLERIATPLLILASEGDRIVSTPAILRAAARIQGARTHVYGAEAAHEILREVDAVRDDALARINLFFAEHAPRP